MKKLLTLTLFSTLVACSQNPDNLTLSCYGAVIKTEAKQEFVTPQVSRTYKFHNYKIDNYECAQQANIISCNFVKEENGTRQRKRIIYDTSTQSFAEIDAIWAVGEKINTNERNIARTEFLGRCQKPILN
jgi:Tfp pilus assembly protein PilP